MAKKSQKDLTEEFDGGEKFSESYLSIGLGLLVVLVVGVLLFNFFTKKNNQSQNVPQEDTATQEQTESAPTEETSGAHTITEGETLWSIAEDTYNSGYEWERIAQENGISNPNAIETGQQITLPILQNNVVLPETGISDELGINQGANSTYVVQDGDSLWNIACNSYNDCYRWSEIANANNIEDPGIILVGSELQIPQ